ncbi:MAG TPA: glycosyltransferase [Chloroflexia bacterium]|nr:glycosyltransferase [Chloroflexia bacterium]
MKSSNFLQASQFSKRLAIVYDGIEYGGVENNTLMLMRNLDRSRYQPAVVISGYNYQFAPKLFLQKVEAEGIPILVPEVRSKSRYISVLDDILGLRRVFKEAGIDIIHIRTSNLDGGRRATLAARLAGVPAVMRSEHLPPSVNATSSSRYWIKPFDMMTDCIVTGSQFSLNEQLRILGRPRSKLYSSYNGIDLDRFKPGNDTVAAKSALGLDPNIPVIGSVGRFVPQKGFIYLVEASAQIIQEYGPVNFVLVGSGPLEKELKEKAEALGVTKYFHFVGFQSKPQAFIEAMDIVTLPSLYEEISITLLECMAMGKPAVVSSDTALVEAVVDGKTGYVTTQRDSKALAEGLLKLLQDPISTAVMGQAALDRVRTHFSITRLANDMMNLYDRLLGYDQTGKILELEKRVAS